VINFIKKYKILLGVTIALFFSACNGENRNNIIIDEPQRDIVGNFIDSAVEGVEYKCGKIEDVTDENGTFSCVTLPVSFNIGAITLGTLRTLPTDRQVFPQDIVDVNRSDVNNTQVIKLALLLQSLDNDNNASNGITIASGIKDIYTEEIVVFDITMAELKNQMQNKDVNLTFKDVAEVVKHLSSSIGIINESNITIVIDNNNTTVVIDNNNTTVVIDNNNTTVVIDNNNTTVVIDNNNTTVVIDNNNTTVVIDNNNTSVVIDNNNTSVVIDNNNTTVVIDNNNTTHIITDTIAPNAPSLTTTPKFTNQENLRVQVHGESNTTLFVNNFSSGSLNAEGLLNLSLDTSGEDGVKDFNLTLKDSSSNESSLLYVKIIKDATSPAKNATITPLTTDDTTPPLEGKLPSGENDTNTTNYTIIVNINNENYNAINNKDGKWSISDDTIDVLEMGRHDINITVTDEANNSSSTFVRGKIEIDNTGFLIDSALEGIKYISGAYNGYTDKDGLFKYDKGAGITFYIGDESTGILLGTSTQKVDPFNKQRRIVTLFDLAGTQDENSTRVINMGKFLQSLDSDNDVSNGITIDDRTKESIALLGLNNRIDFNMDVESFHNHNDIYELFNDLAGHFGEHRGLISSDDVKAHLVAVRDNVLVTKSYEVAKVSGKKEVIKVLEGVFQSVGGVVEGLEYRSGNQFGRTSSTGTFKYEEGKKIKFYIYQLELGITDAKAVVTPADLIPATSFNHPKPRNIIRLLNAFDAPNSSNILIDDAVRESLEKYRSQIDINLPDGKANAELNIPQGADEFGAQFEDFEMGKDILDEIDTIRGSL